MSITMFRLSVILTNDPRHAKHLRDEVALLLSHFDAAQGDIERAQLVVSEGFSNVVQHAYNEPGNVCTIDLELSADRLSIVITDYGCGLDPRDTYRQPAIHEMSGRGLPLIQSMADSMEIDSIAGNGTKLTACFRLHYRSDETHDRALEMDKIDDDSHVEIGLLKTPATIS